MSDPGVSAADDGAMLGEVATRLLFENRRVRVWEMDLEPGEASALHRHALDYVLVILEGDRIAARAPGDGPAARASDIEAEVRPGQVFFVEAGNTETAVNVGRRRYHEILIELKDGAGSA